MSDTNNRDLNYRSSLDRARRRRNRNRYQRYALIGEAFSSSSSCSSP